MRGRLQLQLDRALEPQAQQLLRVADQEVDGPVGPGARDDGGHSDEVVKECGISPLDKRFSIPGKKTQRLESPVKKVQGTQGYTKRLVLGCVNQGYICSPELRSGYGTVKTGYKVFTLHTCYTVSIVESLLIKPL